MRQVKIGQDGAALCKDGENFLLTPKMALCRFIYGVIEFFYVLTVKATYATYLSMT